MAISDRTLYFRGKVFSIESGRTFEALIDSAYEGMSPDSYMLSKVVPHSEKVVLLLRDS